MRYEWTSVQSEKAWQWLMRWWTVTMAFALFCLWADLRGDDARGAYCAFAAIVIVVGGAWVLCVSDDYWQARSARLREPLPHEEAKTDD